MRALTAADLLCAWERGQGQHPVDRALTLLGLGWPDAPWEELAMLPVAERDARLLALRAQTWGGNLPCLARCPGCSQDLEFSLDVDQILADWPERPPSESRIEVGEMAIRYRLPNSLDLAAAAGCTDLAAARDILLRRCLLEAQQGGEPLASEALPEPVAQLLASQMAAAEPLGEVEIDLACPTCGQAWTELLDIVSYFWTEIAWQAQRLALEVHQLARAYGWREADILAMSPQRRELYLEMVLT